MIGRLALAQLRAHRGQTAWLAGLLTVLAGIVTYVLVVGATQGTIARQVYEATRGEGERGAWVPIAVEGVSGYTETLTPEEFAAAASEAGNALAMSTQVLYTSPLDEWGGPTDGEWVNAGAYLDPADMEPYLLDGALPTERGQVAVTQRVADKEGVDVGDSLVLYAGEWLYGADHPTARPMDFEVVGIITSSHLPGYDLWGQLPDALTSWNEVTEPDGALARRDVSPDGEEFRISDAYITWDGSSRELDAFLDYPLWSGEPEGALSPPASTAPWFGAAFTLVAAMVVMSFAVGRSQAAARTQWVATTRTLGASRRYVAAASVVETALIAAVALAAGLGLGLAAGQAQLSAARAMVDGPFGPSTVTVHWATVPIVAAVLALVTIIVSAVPAFWASRVPPAAALKPVNDVTEAELSRRVPVAWLWIPFVGGLAAIWQSTLLPFGLFGILETLGTIAVAVTGFALTVEWARRLVPLVGRWMARSPRRAVMAAGDALRLRPRQAVAPALISAVGAGVVTWVAVNMSTELALANSVPGYTTESVSTLLDWAISDTFSSGFWAALAVAACASQLVIAAIAVSHRGAVVRETGALRALGLSKADEMRAFWWQQWIPQVVGMGIGVVVAEAVCVGTGLFEEYPGNNDALALRGVIALIPVTAIAAAVLAVAALVGWVVARFTTRATPVAALRPAH